MRSIFGKVRWIVIVLSINLMTIIMVDIWLNSSQKFDATVINIAGKQRMLSQRTVLELHRLYIEEGSYEKLQKARAEFDRNFKLLSASTSQFRGFKNENIDVTLKEVQANWNSMNVLIDRYVSGGGNRDDLRAIYQGGDKTLFLMDKAVSQYEASMMDKRVLAHRLQIFLGCVSLGIILYMVRNVLSIKRDFEKFLAHSEAISGGHNVDYGENELEIACSHIDHFLKSVDEVLQSATDAVEKSELATSKLHISTPEASALIEQSEDVMIQVSEELHQTALRFKKLKGNLEKAHAMKNLF